MKDKMRNRFKKYIPFVSVLLVSVALLLAAVSYSIAYLSWTNEEPIINMFVRARPDIEIEEDFDEIKKDVAIKNVGNIDIYVRVHLRPEWMVCDDSEPEVCETSGIAADDLVITVPSTWIKLGDFYYYKTPLPAGDTTAVLVGQGGIAAPTAPADGLKYRVDVVSSSIQAEPAHAVETAWGVVVTNNEIVGEQP